MAPLAANFASFRRMECSTSTPGERLKCVRPSLSNSATSLTCTVVAMGSPIRAENINKGQTNYSPSKSSDCQMIAEVEDQRWACRIIFLAGKNDLVERRFRKSCYSDVL